MFINLAQYNNIGILLVQAILGIIFIAHGWPKIKNKNPIFGIGGLFHGLVEAVGGLLMAVNLFVQPIAIIFAVIMLGALYFNIFKWKKPFAAPAQGIVGWEFDLLILAVSLWLVTV